MTTAKEVALDFNRDRLIGNLHKEPGFDVSIVMPCLDEAASLPACIEEAQTAVATIGITGEVIVVDNGSTDDSARVARGAGARVLLEPNRGYGHACRLGMGEARGRILVLGDADGTYDFRYLPHLVDPLLAGQDFVIGSRFDGSLDPGAMPWLHRHVGNPVLTGIMNLLYLPGITDAQCGMRAITREAYERLSLSAPGMEFASEFLIQVARHDLRVVEVPIRYRKRSGGKPKLRTFRDGARHIRLMTREARLGPRFARSRDPQMVARP